MYRYPGFLVCLRFGLIAEIAGKHAAIDHDNGDFFVAVIEHDRSRMERILPALQHRFEETTVLDYGVTLRAHVYVGCPAANLLGCQRHSDSKIERSSGEER